MCFWTTAVICVCVCVCIFVDGWVIFYYSLCKWLSAGCLSYGLPARLTLFSTWIIDLLSVLLFPNWLYVGLTRLLSPRLPFCLSQKQNQACDKSFAFFIHFLFSPGHRLIFLNECMKKPRDGWSPHLLLLTFTVTSNLLLLGSVYNEWGKSHLLLSAW